MQHWTDNFPGLASRFGALLLALLCWPAAHIAVAQPIPESVRSPSPEVAQERLRLEARYPKGPDSFPHPAVPKGEISSFNFSSKKSFPGTSRTIRLYVPAQYKGDQPAALYLVLDGFFLEEPVVFDNLIARGEMPVTIAVVVEPSMTPSALPPANPRFNRSNEFDSVDDRLFRLIDEEVLPAVERRRTQADLPIRLTRNPDLRAAAGGSSGGIGAFTLGWTHPESFRRIFSAIGTFVGMRGGDAYPVLVRKTEPKPLRIFLQDGSRDNLDHSLGEVGNWWLANQAMESALQFAGYDVQHAWGEGGHDGIQATRIFPDAMRWLWRGWQNPVKARPSNNIFFKDILIDDEQWRKIETGAPVSSRLASAPDGSVWFDRGNTAWRIDPRGSAPVAVGAASPGVSAFDPEGVHIRSDISKDIIVIAPGNGKRQRIAAGIRATDMVVTHDGRLYAIDRRWPGHADRLWLVTAEGRKALLDDQIGQAAGLSLSADGLWLTIGEANGRWLHSYRVLTDGRLEQKERFYWLHLPDTPALGGTGQLVQDRQGRLYIATAIGIQIADRSGRVRAILPLGCGPVTGLAWGGSKADFLYASCADGSLYRRRLKIEGARAMDPAVTLPEWRR